MNVATRSGSTLMHLETAEAPDAVRKLLRDEAGKFGQIAGTLKTRPPKLIVTNARGTSDHASVFGKYLLMTRSGVPTFSGSPAVTSVYRRRLAVEDALCVSVSQSGQSPDIVNTARAMAESGASTLTFTNSPESPLARASDYTVDLRAEAEKSVAATKSCIASLAAYLALTAYWCDPALKSHLSELPDLLDAANQLSWSDAFRILTNCHGLYVIGRGPSLGVANEMALKFKETCQLHAEAFSAAECPHGPLTLVGPDFPVILLVQDDESRDSTLALGERMIGLGAPVIVAGADLRGAICLPTVEACSDFAPVAMLQTFYTAVADLALLRGRSPDTPPALSKVTETH